MQVRNDIRVDNTLRERFYQKFIPVPEAGCWIWEASIAGGPMQRGHIKVATGKRSGIVVSAHRVSWLLHRGPIPSDMYVLHRCDVPLCVNPYHLFLGTHQDNMDDRGRKGRSRGRFSQ